MLKKIEKKSKDSKKTIKFSLVEFFFPIISYIRQINSESDTNEISNNAWSLIENDVEYHKIIKKISDARIKSEENQNIVFID